MDDFDGSFFFEVVYCYHPTSQDKAGCDGLYIKEINQVPQIREMQIELVRLRTALADIKSGVKHKFIPLSRNEMRKIAASALDKVREEGD